MMNTIKRHLACAIMPIKEPIVRTCLELGYSTWDEASPKTIKRYFSSAKLTTLKSFLYALGRTTLPRILISFTFISLSFTGLACLGSLTESISPLTYLFLSVALALIGLLGTINIAPIAYIFLFLAFIWKTSDEIERAYLTGTIRAINTGWIAKCQKMLGIKSDLKVDFESESNPDDTPEDSDKVPLTSILNDAQPGQMDGVESMFFLNQPITPIKYPFFVLSVARLLWHNVSSSIDSSET